MPAAAVIPAPIAYIKVVAVKTLVVGSWNVMNSVHLVVRTGSSILPFWILPAVLNWIAGAGSANAGSGFQIVYFEEIRVFKAGVRLEYCSMG